MIESLPEISAPKTVRSENSIPTEDLQKLAGKWVAQRSDGSHIIAFADDLAELDRLILETGENPEEVLLLRVPDGNMVFSGAEFQ
jgi:hypothetical protein